MSGALGVLRLAPSLAAFAGAVRPQPPSDPCDRSLDHEPHVDGWCNRPATHAGNCLIDERLAAGENRCNVPPMAKTDADLAEAAADFDRELAAYTRLGELFLGTALSSVKQLERANGTLAEIASCEERLQAAGQRMVQALGAARGRQEQLAKDVVAHVPVVQARNQKLKELMAELGAVATEVGGLNTAITRRDNGDATRPPTLDAARDISATLMALSERAAQLAIGAREAEFEELATQAHALHQRLQAISKKIHKAVGD